MDIRPLVPLIIFSKTYRESIPITESTAEALVIGWNEALEKILTSLTEDIPEKGETE